jgi:predicted flavoprotein YhiN
MTFQKPREYTVDDQMFQKLQEPSVEEQEQIFKEARIAKQRGERLNDGAKRRVEILLEMFRSTRTVMIKGQEVVLQSLKAKEIKEATKKSFAKTYELEASLEVRSQVLARSIVSIGGVPFEELIQSNDVDQKVLFLDEMDDLFVTKLWVELQEMNESVKVEYGLAKANVIEEVVADIKK